MRLTPRRTRSLLVPNREITLALAIKNGSMFVANGLLVPPSLRFEGQSYSKPWKLLRNLNRAEIEVRAHECGWNFFFVAELTKRTAIGLDCGRTLRRAADRILLDDSAVAYNAVEITGLAVRRFLGLYWVTLTADSRSLQKSTLREGITERRRQLA